MMPTKSKHTNKFLLVLLSFFGLLALAVIIVPPMVHINNLKPKIEEVILAKTGIQTKIHGNINFSLMGNAAIVAHNVSVPNGVISSIEFGIPLFDMFNIKNANISGDILVKDASLYIEKIVPFETNNNIIVKNSKIKFLNKEYNIIHADISRNNVNAFVRTDQHKYEIKYTNNDFVVQNKNNNLRLTGKLNKDGTATGNISIVAQDVNKWFEFQKPKITGQFPITADFLWDGEYGIMFDNISANGVQGSIEYKNDGYKIIKLKSDVANYDMSFFLKNPDILQNTSFDLDFYGKLSLLDNKFNHLKIVTNGSDNKINIDTVIADTMQMHGGFIDKNGAHDINVSLPENGVNTTCLFSGTPTNWSCSSFSYGKNVTGKFTIDKSKIDADIYSSVTFDDINSVVLSIKKLGNAGIAKFDFPDMSGTLYITKNNFHVIYNHLDNKSLNWYKTDLKFLPESMKNEPGNFVWVDGAMIFTPHSDQWQLSKHNDFFILHGKNIKQFLGDIDSQSLKDLPYTISGNYKNGNISNLTVDVTNNKFSGSVSEKSITLKTDALYLDSFINQEFINNFEELSFFTNHPILLPFELNKNIALYANKLVYDNKEYNNFIYSLRKNTQTFSISDSSRGNLLATINKDNIKYVINIQLNKFVFDKKILPESMPLNISDTSITAEIKLNTFGKIAHDIIDNIRGTFDASLDGGKLYGLGLAEFYASAPNLTTLNGEFALYNALTSGISPIKKMHIVGMYENGDVKTSTPLTLYLPHTDATGILEIKNNEMIAKLKLVLRGTSAGPEPIDLTVYPNNVRDFSLSEIMLHFDPEYMREFVKSHNQF